MEKRVYLNSNHMYYCCCNM